MIVQLHDYGHGGSDVGTTSGGMYEKDVQLRLGMLTSDLLEKRYQVKVIRSRVDDRDVSLNERVNMAQHNRAQALISFHHNALPSNPVANGFEIYIYGPVSYLPAVKNGVVNHKAPNSYIRAVKLEEVLEPFCKNWGMKWNGIKCGDFHVLREFNGEGILFEAGYASNENDAALLKNPEFIHDLANTYADAIAYAWDLSTIQSQTWGEAEHAYLLEKGIITELQNLDKPADYRWVSTILARVLSRQIYKDGRF